MAVWLADSWYLCSGVLCGYFPPAETTGLCHQVPNLFSLQRDCFGSARHPCFPAPAAFPNMQRETGRHQPEMCLLLDHLQQVRPPLRVSSKVCFRVLHVWLLAPEGRHSQWSKVYSDHMHTCLSCCLSRKEKAQTLELETGSPSQVSTDQVRWIVLISLRKVLMFFVFQWLEYNMSYSYGESRVTFVSIWKLK